MGGTQSSILQFNGIKYPKYLIIIDIQFLLISKKRRIINTKKFHVEDW